MILTGLLLTGSRGGIIATGLGFLVLARFECAERKDDRCGTKRCLLIFAVLVVGAVFVGFSDVFVGRVGAHGLYEQGRSRVFLVTILSILAAPLLGFGYGTFSAAFPMFHDESVSIWIFLGQGSQ